MLIFSVNVLLIVACVYVTVTRPRSSPDMMTLGFAERIRAGASVECIRQWRMRVARGTEGSREIAPADWPPCIRELEPTSVYVQRGEGVELSWGNRLVSFGMMVSARDAGDGIPPGAIQIDGGYVWSGTH
jgi:hypothetical protein